MIIRNGDTITLRAGVSPDSGIGGGSITWEPVTEGVNAETVARAVTSHDALLGALKFSVSVHRAQGLYDLSERVAVEKAEAAIAKAEGK